jgi:hypothetical protein
MTDIDADADANTLARIFIQRGETSAMQGIIDLLGPHA